VLPIPGRHAGPVSGASELGQGSSLAAHPERKRRAEAAHEVRRVVYGRARGSTARSSNRRAHSSSVVVNGQWPAGLAFLISRAGLPGPSVLDRVQYPKCKVELSPSRDKHDWHAYAVILTRHGACADALPVARYFVRTSDGERCNAFSGCAFARGVRVVCARL
jgi:hypothetical protein